MDSRIPSPKAQIVAATTAPRPTPTPKRVKFAEVLARGAGTFVRGAEAAMTKLPGSPLMAVALRGGASVPVSATPMSNVGMPPGGLGGGSAEGPGGNTTSPASVLGATAASAAGGLVPGAAGVGGAGAAGAGDGGVESSLAQAQEMNLYYLQIQEAVNAQNRTFSTLSNVMKAEHDTVKTAIGNIR